MERNNMGSRWAEDMKSVCQEGGRPNLDSKLYDLFLKKSLRWGTKYDTSLRVW